MVLTKLVTLDRLAILGAVFAILSPLTLLGFDWSPFMMHYGWNSFYYYVPVIILSISFTGGVIGFILSLRASSFMTKMPQRAASHLLYAGIIVLILGICCLYNYAQILVGIFITILGIETDAIFRRIQRARRITGWPYRTVATAAGGPWAQKLSCQFCGAPLVVRKAISYNHLLQVSTECPLDKTHDEIQLPLSQLESWTPFLADRLHRCDQCGDRTTALLVVQQNGLSSQLKAYCFHGHPNRRFRTIWAPLYPHVAHMPDIDAGFRAGLIGHPSLPVASMPSQRPISGPESRASWSSSYSSTAQPIPISVRIGPVTSQLESHRYCPQCGVHVDVSDLFCFRCGNSLT